PNPPHPPPRGGGPTHRGGPPRGRAPPPPTAAERVLRRHGYRTRIRRRGESRLIAAMRGRGNRLGYVFTHLAVVVICLGALIDGNLPLKVREWAGQIQPETRMLPVHEIPSASRLPPDSGPFRGIVTIPEGDRASVVFMARGNGYLLRQLPFMVEVEAFRIEHYTTGEPRAFESDVVLHAPDLEEPLRATVGVNRPLRFRGHTLYQASFGDGGSTLRLRAWPLVHGEEPFEMEARVAAPRPLPLKGPDYLLEPEDFSLHNIQNVPGGDGSNRNLGPSFRFRLRAATGEAREFENFMLPVMIDGHRFFISGVRASGAEPFRYLHIPADIREAPDTFLHLFALLSDPDRVAALADAAVAEILPRQADEPAPMLQAPLARTTRLMVEMLLERGFPGAIRYLEQRLEAADMDREDRERWQDLAEQALEATVEGAYREAALLAGIAPDAAAEPDGRFLQYAVESLPAMQRYGAPAYLQLVGFDQRQATGLEVARSPGRPVVYLGFALLVTGIVLMFYVAHRRVWCLLRPHPDGGCRVLLAGSGQRDPVGSRAAFLRLADDLQALLPRHPTGRTVD
ncbi:MAG: cytochrome c biogenesis protein ResB, partial [Ectothiorhodospiraceae bacterium]|nr:cytochrome c biogenesis protein ResB [Ectothiorhodospiraceae bacterium]